MNGQEAGSKHVSRQVRSLILISANSFWNIANFRAGLVESLAESHDLVIAAPDHDPSWALARKAQSVEIAIDRAGLNPLKDLLLIFSYHKLMKQYRPSFFLGFTAKPNIYGSIAARLAGTTSIPNVSGLGTAFINSGPLSALVGFLYRLAFRTCPIVFFQNADDRDLFLSRKIVRASQARLLPGSGVNLDHFTPSPVRSDAIRFLFVGRMLGDKGIREFVEAAGMLKRDNPQWQFQLLGPVDEGNRSGIGRTELEQWVASGAVEYLGEASDVRPFVADATAVVLPSYREGLPRSLLEAAAMARPLIATDVPGNRHLVRHGVNGLLCDARDPGRLADAMRIFGELSDDERTAMGRAARQLVEQQFDERTVISAYLDALKQLSPAPGVG